MDPALAELVGKQLQRGNQQFQLFMDALQNKDDSFYDSIKKNKAAFFKQEHSYSSSKEEVLVEHMESHMSMPSLEAMLYSLSEESGKHQHGKPGMSLTR